MTLRLFLELPEDYAYIRTTRHVARSLLQGVQVEATTIHDVENIIGELCSNVVRHAQSSTLEFSLSVEVRPDVIIVEAADSGQGFDVNQIAPSGTLRPDEDGKERYGGFGLKMIEGLSDTVTYSTGTSGTTVRVVKKRT